MKISKKELTQNVPVPNAEGLKQLLSNNALGKKEQKKITRKLRNIAPDKVAETDDLLSAIAHKDGLDHLADTIEELGYVPNTTNGRALINGYLYPKDAYVQEHLDAIYGEKFSARMPDLVRESCRLLGAAFTAAIPHFDRYKLYSESLEITDQDLALAFIPGQWEALPVKIKNKVRRTAEKMKARRQVVLEDFAAFINRQAQHMDALTDEELEEIEALEGEVLSQGEAAKDAKRQS